MAKTKSVIAFQGTFDNITYVTSKVYGNHIRAARGTHKKATVNDAFKEESKRLLHANIPAKILKDAIEPYRDEVKGGLLWQRLVSMFKRQISDHGSFDFSKLKPFEVHANYPLERFMSVQTKVKPDREQSTLNVTVSYNTHPRFERSSFIDGYMLSVIIIFPYVKGRTAKIVAVHSKVIALTGEVPPLQVKLDIPPRAKTYILCVKLDGCMKGKVNDTPSTKGLRVVGAGLV